MVRLICTARTTGLVGDLNLGTGACVRAGWDLRKSHILTWTAPGRKVVGQCAAPLGMRKKQGRGGENYWI